MWSDKQAGNWRFEFKYVLPLSLYRQVRSALVPYTEPDEYTRKSPSGAYSVRSLYYDTADFQAYHEKMGGDYGRTKIRIRTYSTSLSEKGPVRVELKTRRGTPMEKFSTFVSLESCLAFLQTKHWPEPNDPVLIEFERLVHFRAMRPKLLVDYEREGLMPRSREAIRITFDRRVRSASSSSLFPERAFFRAHDSDSLVLEIKCRHDQPLWLTALIKQYGLKPEAHSKYTRGIEISRPDVVTPMWSQGIVDSVTGLYNQMSPSIQRPFSRTL